VTQTASPSRPQNAGERLTCYPVLPGYRYHLRLIGVGTRLLLALLLLCPALAAPDSAPPGREPVLVELFTSEGCSSCPPADELLARLDQLQSVPGVTVLALEEHVDYWDRLGWRDPFSSSEFTARQKRYADLLHIDSPYTPQMVIDGHSEFSGNDAPRVLRALADAARGAKAHVVLAVNQKSGDRMSLSVQVESSPAPGDVILAITETGLASDVTRGENAGRNLRHSPVVRKLAVIGRLKTAEAFSAEPEVKLAKQWKPENLRAVVFVEERSGARVVGAGEIRLSR